MSRLTGISKIIAFDDLTTAQNRKVWIKNIKHLHPMHPVSSPIGQKSSNPNDFGRAKSQINYVVNSNALRYAHTLITFDVTRPIRHTSIQIVLQNNRTKRNAIRWAGRIDISNNSFPQIWLGIFPTLMKHVTLDECFFWTFRSDTRAMGRFFGGCMGRLIYICTLMTNVKVHSPGTI